MAVGFVGLGNIGAPMARRLCVAGLKPHLYDINAAALQSFASLDCVREGDVTDLGRKVDVVGVCVRDDHDLESVLAAPHGLLATLAAGSVVLVHSTVRPETIRVFAARSANRGVTLLDAPVTGGAHFAEQGNLTTMVGGPADVLERVRPVLEAFSRRIIHAGPVAAGMTLKVANNLVTMLELLAAHESARLMERSGLDPALLLDVMTENGNLTDTMRRFLDFRRDGPRQMGTAEFEALQTRMGRLVTKDLEVALAAARDCGVTLPATETASRLMMDVFLDR